MVKDLALDYCIQILICSILGSAPQGGFPTELTSDEDMEIDLGEWRRINVLYECD
jgi:hypothetical protein